MGKKEKAKRFLIHLFWIALGALVVAEILMQLFPK